MYGRVSASWSGWKKQNRDWAQVLWAISAENEWTIRYRDKVMWDKGTWSAQRARRENMAHNHEGCISLDKCGGAGESWRLQSTGTATFRKWKYLLNVLNEWYQYDSVLYSVNVSKWLPTLPWFGFNINLVFYHSHSHHLQYYFSLLCSSIAIVAFIRYKCIARVWVQS